MQCHHLSQVDKEDVNEAMRLMEMSKDSLETSNDGEGRGRAESVTDRIYKLVRDMGEDARTLKIADIRERWVSCYSCGQGGTARHLIALC